MLAAGNELGHKPKGMGTTLLPGCCQGGQARQAPSSHHHPQTPFAFSLWHPSKELSTGQSERHGARSWAMQE